MFPTCQQMRTDNTMMKSQLAWWYQIDNSYYAIIPNVDVAAYKACLKCIWRGGGTRFKK